MQVARIWWLSVNEPERLTRTSPNTANCRARRMPLILATSGTVFSAMLPRPRSGSPIHRQNFITGAAKPGRGNGIGTGSGPRTRSGFIFRESSCRSSSLL